jgi:Skp family chaperone for outer membrane proteins
MKRLGLLLTGGFILFLVLAVGIVKFFQGIESAQTPLVVPVDPTITALQAQIAADQADYQAQLTALAQNRQQQDAAFQQQAQGLTGQIKAAQQQLTDLKSQEQEFLAQVEQLQNTRAERQHAYQTSLEQTSQTHLTPPGNSGEEDK